MNIFAASFLMAFFYNIFQFFAIKRNILAKFIKELIRLSSSYHLQSQKGQWLSKLLLKILTLPESRLTENGGLCY